MELLTNQYLLDYVGKTGTKKVLDDATKFLLETKCKFLGFTPRPNLVSLVHVEDKKEITSIGGSTPPDLLSDNFGEILAAWHRNPTTSAKTVSLINTSNAANLFNVHWRQFGGTTNNYSGMWTSIIGAPNGGIQVGQGTTPAVRTDFDIETPFANGGLEDGRVVTQNPVYDNVNFRVQMAINFNATGGGDISESVLLNRYLKALPRALHIMLMSRDIITPVVNFIATQSVFVQYTLQL